VKPARKGAEYAYQTVGLTTTAGNEIDLENAVCRLLPPEPRRVLEVGCGNGRFTSRLASLGHEVIATDTSTSGIALARTHFGPLARYEVHSAYDDFRKLTPEVDIVLAKEVIEHLVSPKEFLANAHSVLPAGGRLILSTPYHGYLKNLALSVLDKWDNHHGVDWDGGHIKFFSVRTLRKMVLDSGFSQARFVFVGRFHWLWKSMICLAIK
jgi:SAM-dependent methyltransferase